MKIHIRTDNAAFGDDRGRELARILREIADRIEQSDQPRRGEIWTVRNANGNTVGTVRA